MTRYLSAGHLRLLLAYLRPQRPRVVSLAMLLLIAIGLDLASPQVVRAFVDATQTRSGGISLTLAAVLYLAATLGQRAVALVALYADRPHALQRAYHPASAPSRWSPCTSGRASATSPPTRSGPTSPATPSTCRCPSTRPTRPAS